MIFSVRAPVWVYVSVSCSIRTNTMGNKSVSAQHKVNLGYLHSQHLKNNADERIHVAFTLENVCFSKNRYHAVSEVCTCMGTIIPVDITWWTLHAKVHKLII